MVMPGLYSYIFFSLDYTLWIEFFVAKTNFFRIGNFAYTIYKNKLPETSIFYTPNLKIYLNWLIFESY